MRICWPMEFSTTGATRLDPAQLHLFRLTMASSSKTKRSREVRALALRRRAEADGDIAQMLPADGALDDRAIMAESVVAEADLRGERGGATADRVQRESA